MSTTIKWDHSEVVDGVRVRTISFQDHLRATLVDTDNKQMQLTTWDGGEKLVMATAKRAGRVWTVSVFTETMPVSRKIVKRDRPIYRFDLTKSEAVDFMCQNS